MTNVAKRIHVVHIITRLDMGGSAQNTLLTLLHLPPERYRLTLITGPSEISDASPEEKRCLNQMMDAARRQGIRIIESPYLTRSVSLWKDVAALWSLIVLLKGLMPHGVHTHTSKAGFIGRIAARIACRAWLVHTPHGHVFWGHFGRLASLVFFYMEKLACKITDHLVALTRGEAEDYRRLRVIDSDALSIVPSGVPLERFSCSSVEVGRSKREALKLPEKALVVGFVGWLWPVKGVRFLIEAMIDIMREQKNVYLVIVGQGDEEIALRERVREEKLEDRVLFLGWRPDIHHIMPCLDLFVLPSLNEGMGRVLVEAMATGLPVVGTRVGGIPDLIRHGENGLLVPPGDSAALKDAILCLLEDDHRCRCMGELGRTFCEEYSVEAMVREIDLLYKRLQCRRRRD